MKLRTLLKSFSALSLIFLVVGVFILIQLVSGGDFSLLKPAHDYDYVLENGLKSGDHIKGDIFYSLGGFASKETYTQGKDYRTPGKTSGYYYIIPVGESGMAAIYIRKDDLGAMDTLTDETFAYLMGGEAPATHVPFNGVAVKMKGDLKGLQSYFDSTLEEMGYTEADIEAMLADTGGEYLVLQGPANVSVIYGMMVVSLLLIAAAVVLFLLKYRKQRARETKIETEWKKA